MREGSPGEVWGAWVAKEGVGVKAAEGGRWAREGAPGVYWDFPGRWGEAQPYKALKERAVFLAFRGPTRNKLMSTLLVMPRNSQDISPKMTCLLSRL